MTFKESVDNAIADGWILFISSVKLPSTYASLQYQGKYTREVVLLHKEDFKFYMQIEGAPREPTKKIKRYSK